MAEPKRVLGLSRVLAPGALACLVLGSGACGGDPGGQPEPWGDEGSGGAASAGFSGAPPPKAGSASTGGSVGIAGAACELPAVESPVFGEQVFSARAAARREFFSWTTDEQASALRANQELFTQTERPGLGPGYAFTALQELAQADPDFEDGQLASLLSSDLFAKGRYAWLEPWATRMGWPGETYGGNLLRILLKPEAWLVVVRRGTLSVFDLENRAVSLADALANPGRLGAIFYQRDAFSGGPDCGSFLFGGGGYREFIVGNLEMVEEWSLGTSQIRDRLSANIDQLSHFLARVRTCPVTISDQQWNLQVACGWDSPQESPYTEHFAYEQALAIPSANYVASPDRLAILIETLEGDLFDPDPLVVTPGSPQ